MKKIQFKQDEFRHKNTHNIDIQVKQNSRIILTHYLPHYLPSSVCASLVQLAAMAGSDVASRVVKSFQAFDDSGRGTIDRGDLGRVLKILNPSWSESDLDAILSVTDSKADGKVPFAEFIGWIFEDMLKQYGIKSSKFPL